LFLRAHGEQCVHVVQVQALLRFAQLRLLHAQRTKALAKSTHALTQRPILTSDCAHLACALQSKLSVSSAKGPDALTQLRGLLSTSHAHLSTLHAKLCALAHELASLPGRSGSKLSTGHASLCRGLRPLHAHLGTLKSHLARSLCSLHTKLRGLSTHGARGLASLHSNLCPGKTRLCCLSGLLPRLTKTCQTHLGGSLCRCRTSLGAAHCCLARSLCALHAGLCALHCRRRPCLTELAGEGRSLLLTTHCCFVYSLSTLRCALVSSLTHACGGATLLLEHVALKFLFCDSLSGTTKGPCTNCLSTDALLSNVALPLDVRKRLFNSGVFVLVHEGGDLICGELPARSRKTGNPCLCSGKTELPCRRSGLRGL